MYPASVAAIITPRARMVFAGRVQIKAACSMALCCALVLPIPSHDRAPNVSLPSSAPTSSRPTAAYAATAGDWYTPPRAIKAQTIRAILFASATRTSIDGLRDSMFPSHVPG